MVNMVSINVTITGGYLAKPLIYGAGVKHNRLNAVRNVVKNGALGYWYFTNALQLNAYGKHNVIYGINAVGAIIMLIFHELFHDKVLALYLRIIQRVFHSHHEVVDAKQANNGSHAAIH